MAATATRTIPRTGVTDLGAREAAIVTLLERHAELTDPGTVRSAAGTGTHVALMPHAPSCAILRSSPPRCSCWRRDLDELERLLRLMRGDRHSPLLRLDTGERVSVRACWWHVNAWYLTARWTLFEPPLQKGRKKRPVRLQIDAQGRALPVRRAHREAGAREDVARVGVGWIAAHWSLGHEPMRPVEEAA